MIILGFDVDFYSRFDTNDREYKNVVGLENLTPKERYELALIDSTDVRIWDSVDGFLNEINEGLVDTDGMFFYEYKNN